MTQTEVARRAQHNLIKAQERVGSRCLGTPEDYSGDQLPTPQKAKALCVGCPLSGKGNVCNIYAEVATNLYGVYDGKVYDTHGDVEAGWYEEQEDLLREGYWDD